MIAFSLLAFAAPCLAYDLVTVSDTMRSDANRIIDLAINGPQKTLVWDQLAYMTDTFGPRLSGSDALEASLQWIQSEAQADCDSAYFEPVTVPNWRRNTEWAQLVSPRNKTLHYAGLGMTIGTNGSVITAPVVVVHNFTELNTTKRAEAFGKIVLFNCPWVSYGVTVACRSGAPVWAASVGAVAALIQAVGPWGMQTTHTGGASTGSNGTALVPAGAVSIEDATQLERMYNRGQAPVVSLYSEAVLLDPRPSLGNVIIELQGTDKADEIVVIGGHIDSWDIAEGAIDDGGGVVASWGAVRLLKQLGLRPRRTIRAIAFVNEENGDMGGIQYAKDHLDELNKTSFAIESDEGTFTPYRLTFSGSPTALLQLQILSDLLSPINAAQVVVGGGGVDIGPMNEKGVPVSASQVLDPRSTNYASNPCLGPWWTDTPGAGVFPGISDGYFWYHHTAVDTVDHVAPEQLALNAANLAVWAYTIANLPELLPRGNDPAPPDPRQSPAGAASGASVGVIAGAVVGSLVGVALIAALAYFGRQGKGPLGGCLGGRTDADGVYSMLAKTTAQAGSV